MQQLLDKKVITISVRNLVEFILRSGDIDNRGKASVDPTVMQEGANIHRMIQKEMGSNYHAEYFLSDIIERDDYAIMVEGRADGIIMPTAEDIMDIGELPADPFESAGFDPTVVTIDEIKSTYKELEHIKTPKAVHLAQAKCYAAIYAKQNELERVSVRMTYVNSDTREIRYFHEHYTIEEITQWYDKLISLYARWADMEFHFGMIRDLSIEAMQFPYDFREGQKELIAFVYKAIKGNEKLFCMAPTGVGKTLAAVYPSVKAMGEGRCDKIFYLTAKTITRTVASDCLNLLRTKNLRLKSVVLTAKEKICPLDECECNPEACPMAKGHYDRINDALYAMMSEQDEYSRETITEYSEEYQVCPFELCLDATLFSDVIICDYNYVFDPNVYLRRFFAEGNIGKYFFLVDEAHNLTDRAMDMYSAVLYKEQFLEIRKLTKGYDPKFTKALESCNKYLLGLKRECEDVCVVSDFDAFYMQLCRLMTRIESFLDDNDKFEYKTEVLDFYFDVRHFVNMYESMDDSKYVQYMQTFYDGFMVKLLCANPSGALQKCTERAKFTMFFSATLLPIKYYKNMLGGAEEDNAVYAKSVFDPAKRGLFIARDVTSKYTRRCDDEYEKMAEYIFETVNARNGNYMVFCPSHALLAEVYDAFNRLFFNEKSHEVLLQTTQMSEAEREEFLDRFAKPSSSKSLIGFCVLGGIFSEGIDLKNDSLIGAIIIGTGLPMVCRERELLKNRYSDSGVDGFAFAYRYPGMNKVLQAAGRVIRTIEDVGVVVLLDDRFLSREYMSMFPREWEKYETCTLNSYPELIEDFWNRIGKADK